jgi:STE24 endopeptidase
MIDITPLMLVYLTLVALCQGLEILAERFNARRITQQGGQVPAAVAGWIDADQLAQGARYSIDKLRFGRIRSLTAEVLFIATLLSGLLPALADRLTGWGNIAGGLVFFAAVGAFLFVVDLPFSYWSSFVIEERFGFNTRTKETWAVDAAKSAVLSSAIFAALLSAVLLVMRFAGPLWWVAAWAVLIAFQVGLALVYPALIAPIFNTFTPVQDEALREKILSMTGRAEVRVSGVDQMDASKRTRHTNAYFAGLGRTRRIVLYDSLLSAHDHEEVLAVLAHEIGHLKRRHIAKQLVIAAASTLIMFAAAGFLASWPGLYQGFGFLRQAPYLGLFLAILLLQPVWFFASPLSAGVSRRFEK